MHDSRELCHLVQQAAPVGAVCCPLSSKMIRRATSVSSSQFHFSHCKSSMASQKSINVDRRCVKPYHLKHRASSISGFGSLSLASRKTRPRLVDSELPGHHQNSLSMLLPPVDDEHMLKMKRTWLSCQQVGSQTALHVALRAASQIPLCRTWDFHKKMKWFHQQLRKFQVHFMDAWIVVCVQRDRLLESSFDQFRELAPADFHKEFKFQFLGEFVQDAGGVSREWFQLIIEELFNPNFGLFVFSDVDNITYQINKSSHVNAAHLQFFRFAGQVIGKAVFDQQSLPCALTLPLRKSILCQSSDISDLFFVDVQLAKSLEWILRNSIDNVLFETFSVAEDHFGQSVEHPLVPGGRDKIVTDANKAHYVRCRLRWELFDSIKPQLESFCKGFNEVIPASLLQVFDERELELIICGVPSIDVDDWQRHSQYEGEYHQDHVVISWFWDCVRHQLSVEERTRLLQFATGTSRVPVDGFQALASNRGQVALFTLKSVENNALPLNFPRAHTCFNRLDLPKYETQLELVRMIRAALGQDVTGFGGVPDE